MYTVTPEKMELQPWVEEALFDWDAPLIGGIYIDSLWLQIPLPHVGHQIGFLETSKHKYLKHPKTKAKKKLFLGVSIFACPPALGWWFQPIPAAFLKRLSLCCHLPFVGGQQRICEVSLTNKEMCADLKEKRQKST